MTMTRTASLGVALLLALGGLAAAQPPYPTEFRREEEARGYLPEDLPLRPVPDRVGELKGPQHVPIVRRLRPQQDGKVAAAQGALSGKSVYLSPGHGWTYGASWATQRPNSLGLVEDFSNADGIDWFLVPYLLRAGALVVPVREIDPTTSMVILDDSDGATDPSRGKVVESGPAGVFSASTLKGWGHPTLPLTGAVNPFELGGNRLMDSAIQETARITFIPAVPVSGYYNVYISYSMYSGRASDATVIVGHPGGETRFQVDQRRHGGTWVLLGRFYFEQGTDEQRGAVVFTNQSQDPGSTISADAVRLGGGMGVIDRGGGVSGQARADECSRYHAQLAGAPDTVYNASSGDDHTDDISTRSRFADWVHAPGEPAVFISHHSNAFNGVIRGTETYVYGPNAPDGTYQPTQTTLALGSDKLAKAVHNELIADVRAAYEPGWADRKVKSAYFGELNTANQDEMPAMLIETAFHDQPEDVDALKDAGFRRLVARAIYKGIVKYFAAEEGQPARLLPEPPRAVLARGTGPGQVTVSWRAPASGGELGDPATSYRVHQSAGGYAFDEGRDSGGKTSLVLSGLTPGRVLYLQVTAVNEGGESLPSPTLAVGVSAGGKVPLLLVTAADRIDASMNLQLTYPNLGTPDRLPLDHINNESYLVQHGAALAPSGVPFDACVHGAVDQAAVSLADYRMVLWQGGRGVAGKLALTQASRQALQAAATSGVSLVLSGSHLGRWLGGPAASPEDQAFLGATLQASFVESASTVGQITPASNGLLSGLQPWSLSDWKTGPYEVPDTDVIAAASGATLEATYASPSAPAGAVVQRREGSRCTVLIAHPLESVAPVSRQAEIVAKILDHCGIEAPPIPDGGIPDGGVSDGGPPPGDGEGGGGDGCGCALARRPDGVGMIWVLVALGLVGLGRRRRGRPYRRRLYGSSSMSSKSSGSSSSTGRTPWSGASGSKT